MRKGSGQLVCWPISPATGCLPMVETPPPRLCMSAEGWWGAEGLRYSRGSTASSHLAPAALLRRGTALQNRGGL